AEVAHPRDVRLVAEHPVDAGFETRSDPFFSPLPIADRVVGFEPDRTCHVVRSKRAGLNVAKGSEGFRATHGYRGEMDPDAVLFDLDFTLCKRCWLPESVLTDAFEAVGVTPYVTAADMFAAAGEAGTAENDVEFYTLC